MKPSEMTIEQRLAQVRQRVNDAEQKYGRKTGSVQILAVSKTQPLASLREAQLAGQKAFGENYLQDALPKILGLTQPRPEWHFIGPVQSNKTRDIAENFDWVQSLDRLKIAQRLDQQRPPGLPPLSICLQVNIDNEAEKSGVSPEQVPALAEQLQQLPNLHFRGLMAIPRATSDTVQQRKAFHLLKEIFEQLKSEYPKMDTLSMGMSNDLEAAIAEGATIVRIGTAIFGPRRK